MTPVFCPFCGGDVDEGDIVFMSHGHCMACNGDDNEECPSCGEYMDEGVCPFECDLDDDDEL